MRVLVTRPEPGGQRTAERLSGLGHEAVRMPLFEAEITASVDDLPSVTAVRGLIATSARAFAMFGKDSVPESGLGDVPVHVVGPATAQAARNAGFHNIHDGGGTAQTLSRMLSTDQAKIGPTTSPGSANHAGMLVYLAGSPRTRVIEAAFGAENAAFTVLECYKMTEISYSTDKLKSTFLSAPPDVVLLYSANAARLFSALCRDAELGKMLDSVRFLCLSSGIAEELDETWQNRVVVAERPDEGSLLASLAGLG